MHGCLLLFVWDHFFFKYCCIASIFNVKKGQFWWSAGAQHLSQKLETGRHIKDDVIWNQGNCRNGRNLGMIPDHDPDNLKNIYQLWVMLSQLKSHEITHSFRDTPNDICQSDAGVESAKHFLLPCTNSAKQREILIFTINPVLNSKNQDITQPKWSYFYMVLNTLTFIRLNKFPMPL